VPSAGIEAGHWWGELTADQRGADAFSLTFDSVPLDADTEILGFPHVELHGSSDAVPLHWFARLCDVAPDGTVTLVTGAGRAATRDPLRDAPPAAPGGLPLDLHVTSWVFGRGHRIRLSVSNAMWPMIWPTPYPATAALRLGRAGTHLVLPVVPPATGADLLPVPRFPEPDPAPAVPGVTGWGDMVPVRWHLERDDTGRTAIWWRGTSGSEFSWGRVVDEEYLRYEVADADPEHASMRGEARTEIHLAGRLIILNSELTIGGDERRLRYRYQRQLRDNGKLIRERSWERAFPRIGH
jgi:hypothetical protein